VRLIAILHLQRPIERVGMRPRQHGERRQPLGKTIGQRPSDAAATSGAPGSPATRVSKVRPGAIVVFSRAGMEMIQMRELKNTPSTFLGTCGTSQKYST
jgi:hypothetical protein